MEFERYKMTYKKELNDKNENNLRILGKYFVKKNINKGKLIINNKKCIHKDKKYKELATFYHKENNNIQILRENDLWKVEKNKTIKTDSSVFKIYLMPSGKFWLFLESFIIMIMPSYIILNLK